MIERRKQGSVTTTVTDHSDSGFVTFLNALATSGGNLFLLFMLNLILMAVTVPVMIHFGPASPSVITLVNTFTGVTGALIGILSGSRNDNRNVTTTTTTGPTTTVPMPVAPQAPAPVAPNPGA